MPWLLKIDRVLSALWVTASPFHYSVSYFLAKLSKICETLFSCDKERLELSLLHKNVNTSSHRKGNLMALTTVYQFKLWLKVRYIPSQLSLPRQGPWNLVWVNRVFKLSELHCTTPCTTTTPCPTLCRTTTLCTTQCTTTTSTTTTSYTTTKSTTTTRPHLLIWAISEWFVSGSFPFDSKSRQKLSRHSRWFRVLTLN